MWNADPPSSPLLVGLGPAQGYDQPLPDELQIGEIETHHLRASQPTCEADQQQRPVALIPDAFAGIVEDRPEVFHHQGRRLVLRDSRDSL